MSFLTLRTLRIRTTRTSLPHLLHRPTPPSTILTHYNFSTSPHTSATQDYGSGAGSPEGENPQAQGKNPMEHMEHPGPPAPDVGQGDKSNKPSSGKSEGGGGKSGGSGGDGKSGGGKGLQEGQKQGGESESVRKHNEHFEKKDAKEKGESM